MKTKILFCLAVIGCAVYGCASINQAIAPQVSAAVTRYCNEPLAERQLIRAQVNASIAPATIRVTCPGDTAP